MGARWFPPSERSTFAAIYTSGNQIAAVFALLISSYLCGTTFLGGWPSIFYLFGKLVQGKTVNEDIAEIVLSKFKYTIQTYHTKAIQVLLQVYISIKTYSTSFIHFSHDRMYLDSVLDFLCIEHSRVKFFHQQRRDPISPPTDNRTK